MVWPWHRNDLDRATGRLRGSVKRLREKLQTGAVCAFRLEPFFNELALYLLAPGEIPNLTSSRRGRPLEIRPEFIGGGYDEWRHLVGRSWVGDIPDDGNAEEAVLNLLVWCHKPFGIQDQGKSRVWGIGIIGKVLA
jgi:hypothetical protein